MGKYSSANRLSLLLTLLLLLGTETSCFALAPQEVLVIANGAVKGSVTLAEYYLGARSIPRENLLILQTDTAESCSRTTYNQTIRQPVLKFLRKRLKTQRIRCLVSVFGIPLKIDSTKTDNNEQKTSRAAVDSELSLVLSGNYPLSGWQPNPYFLGFQRRKTLLKKDAVLMVSRLDGPDQKTVRRIIDDSLWSEQNGLEGQACIDARWKKKPDQKNLEAYALYDAALNTAAEAIQKSGRMAVRLDSSKQLFGQNDCPQTALYCGWYSLATYIDAFTWQPGSIGYHIASAECTTLKQPQSSVWCKRMLEEGVAATIGPVNEPFVQGFPRPDIFFSHLIEGYLSLAECYIISLPYLSWQMVLVGDPLYLPFHPHDNLYKLLEKKEDSS